MNQRKHHLLTKALLFFLLSFALGCGRDFLEANDYRSEKFISGTFGALLFVLSGCLGSYFGVMYQGSDRDPNSQVKKWFGCVCLAVAAYLIMSRFYIWFYYLGRIRPY